MCLFIILMCKGKGFVDTPLITQRNDGEKHENHLVLLQQQLGYGDVSIPHSIHEGSDTTAVFAVGAVSTSGCRSGDSGERRLSPENIGFIINCCRSSSLVTALVKPVGGFIQSLALYKPLQQKSNNVLAAVHRCKMNREETRK